MIVIENRAILLQVDEQTGSILRLHSKQFGRDLLVADTPPPPFRLVRDVAFTDGTSLPRVRQADSLLELVWSVPENIEVAAVIRLEEAGGDGPGEDSWDRVVFTAEVRNGGASAVRGLEYPVLPIVAGVDGEELAHSFATGFLVRDPLEAFPNTGDGFRLMPYPEGFAGATAQLCAYYVPGRSGLALACLDVDFAPKWINIYRGAAGMEASVIHGAEELRPGVSFSASYETRLSIIGAGGWFEAADSYKAWAVRQRWCANGWIADQPPTTGGRRLLDTVGASTFGLDARHDRSRWITAYQRDIGTPLLHVLGPDWTRIPRGYARTPAPGDLDEVFPALISVETIKAARANDDLVVPFEFDLFFPPDKAKGEIADSYQAIPDETLSPGAYKFPFLCPTRDAMRELHIERDRRLVAEEDLDGVYYDISANNVIRTCERDDHDHPPGAAAALTRAYRRLYSETREAMAGEMAQAPLIGTEMVNEVFVDQIDFYQARAGGQPAAAFEGGPIRELIKQGRAELIPLFAYLYHEYGPVRLDGWGKLVREAGELFYWLAARIYAWGGLFEINAEFSPSEVIDGVENDPAEHYADIVPRGYRYDADRARYIGRWAKLRLNEGREFLAYGRMLRPPEVSVVNGPAKEAYDWYGYNCPAPWREYEDRGTLEVATVVSSAWQSRSGERACVLCNVSSAPVTVEIEISKSESKPIQLHSRQPVMVHL